MSEVVQQGFFCGVFGKKPKRPKRNTENQKAQNDAFHTVSITSSHSSGASVTVPYTIPSKFEPMDKNLGFGGVAVVGCFKDTESGKIVAIKRNKNPKRQADLIERDITEYLQYSQKAEPCEEVVNFYDCFEHDEILYYIMEYIQGKDLVTFASKIWKMLDKKEIDYDKIIKITSQIAHDILKGMKYIHERRLIHLDLGKENVMILQDPSDPTMFHAKIIDFGHAKLFQPSPKMKRSRSRKLLDLIQKPTAMLRSSSCYLSAKDVDMEDDSGEVPPQYEEHEHQHQEQEQPKLIHKKSSNCSESSDDEFWVNALATHVGKAEICPPECMIKCPRCLEESLQVVGKYQRHLKNVHGLNPSQCSEISSKNLKKFDSRKIDVFGFGICLTAMLFRISKRMHVQYLMYGKETLMHLKPRTPIEENVLDHIRGILKTIPEPLQGLIFGALSANPETRWSVDECLEHLSQSPSPMA